MQRKYRENPVHKAADFLARNHALGGGDRPVIDDELGYEGDGDKFSEADVVEGHLGAFLGGGYGTTGHKPANKKGHYFWGAFRASEHAAAGNLRWLRERIDAHVTFWKMAPVALEASPFASAGPQARAMAWDGREYVLGTSGPQADLRVRLPQGRWEVRRFDALAMKEEVLSPAAVGEFAFDAPDSRAVLFHFKKAGE